MHQLIPRECGHKGRVNKATTYVLDLNVSVPSNDNLLSVLEVCVQQGV
jgi:hypothetical protein